MRKLSDPGLNAEMLGVEEEQVNERWHNIPTHPLAPGECRRLRATEFEERHATLLHQLVVGAAFLTYVLERDDVVWRFIKDCPANRVLEHALFAFATFLVGTAAIICTGARVDVNGSRPPASHTKSRYRGDFLYAIGLASLVPLTGFVILVLGEAIRISRLKRRSDALSRVGVMVHEQAAHSSPEP